MIHIRMSGLLAAVVVLVSTACGGGGRSVSVIESQSDPTTTVAHRAKYAVGETALVDTAAVELARMVRSGSLVAIEARLFNLGDVPLEVRGDCFSLMAGDVEVGSLKDSSGLALEGPVAPANEAGVRLVYAVDAATKPTGLLYRPCGVEGAGEGALLLLEGLGSRRQASEASEASEASAAPAAPGRPPRTLVQLGAALGCGSAAVQPSVAPGAVEELPCGHPTGEMWLYRTSDEDALLEALSEHGVAGERLLVGEGSVVVLADGSQRAAASRALAG